MIHIKELQNIANQYSDTYIKDENAFFEMMDAEQNKYNAKEWYIIAQLAQLYTNIKTGIVSREDGVKEQDTIPIRAEMYIRFC